MENASKALIMAGSILMSLLVISALWFMFGQLSDTQKIKDDVEATDKMVEYSKKFEQYNKTIYGSEILSLANLQDDYKKTQADTQGYRELDIKVYTKGISGIDSIGISTSVKNIREIAEGNYDIADISDHMKKFEEVITLYETEEKYKKRTVKDFVQLSKREIAKIYLGETKFNDLINSDMPDYEVEDVLRDKGSLEVKKLLDDIEKYKEIKSVYSEFKNKRFKCIDADYDKNGRLYKLTYTER